MDLQGNRTTVTRTTGQTTTVHDYNRAGYPVTLANEYQQVGYDDGGGTMRDQIPDPSNGPMYDVKGNLVRDDGFDGLPNAANPTQKDGLLYGYDPENRLNMVEYDDGDGVGGLRTVATYRYDALGRRIEYVKYDQNGQNPATTRYYYDGQNVIAEYSYTEPDNVPTETLARTYVNGSQYIDERVVMRDYASDPQSPRDYYYLHQELYSVAGLARANGSLAEAYVYETYGQARIYSWPNQDLNRSDGADPLDLMYLMANKSGSGTATAEPYMDFDMDGDVDDDDQRWLDSNLQGQLDCDYQVCGVWEVDASPAGNPFLFTGRPTDHLRTVQVLGWGTERRRIQDNRNRVYDPKHGRWLQRDPARYIDGANLYAYVGGRPTNLVDVWGKQASKPGGPGSQPENPLCGSDVKVILGGKEEKCSCRAPCPTSDGTERRCAQIHVLENAKTGKCNQAAKAAMERDPRYREIISIRDQTKDPKQKGRCNVQIACKCCTGPCGAAEAFFIKPGEEPDKDPNTGWPHYPQYIIICQEKGESPRHVAHELTHALSWCKNGKTKLSCAEMLIEEFEAHFNQGMSCKDSVKGAIASACYNKSCEGGDDVTALGALISELYDQCIQKTPGPVQ